MTASLTIYPASGSITAKSTVCRVTVAGADSNTTTGYNTSNYPSEPEMRYYIFIDAPTGTDDARSFVFGPDHSGGFVFDNYVFPAAGSYTLRLRNASNDANVGNSLAVTVS